MKKSKHSDSEKVKAVKSFDGGVSADVICREHGISRSTLYQWRSKYGGMEVLFSKVLFAVLIRIKAVLITLSVLAGIPQSLYRGRMC
jgi:hypothetical protein